MSVCLPLFLALLSSLSRSVVLFSDLNDSVLGLCCLLCCFRLSAHTKYMGQQYFALISTWNIAMPLVFKV